MTQRERHTPGQAPPRDATPIPAAQPGSSSSPAVAPPAAENASLWSEWYHRASPAQQQDALQRAVSQGILHAHELPAPARAAAPPRSLLPSLLNGQIKELEPLHPPALAFHDGELDAMQRDAVARAVATPDVCLIQGFPGTGKSRVIAEVILQAAQRGEHILFLASTAAALDRVLERLGAHPALCPIRCLAGDESEAALPPTSARLTLNERMRSYRENAVPAARSVRDAARAAFERRMSQPPPWARLEELARQEEGLAVRMRELSERREGIAASVQRGEEGGELFRERWATGTRGQAEALEQLDGQLAGLRAERDTIAAKLSHLESEWEKIRPLAEARQGNRIWTAAWWGSRLRSGWAEQMHELETRRDELATARERLERDIDAAQTERGAIESRFDAKLQQLRDEEIARQQNELDREIATVAGEQDALRRPWQALRAAAADAIPAEMNAAALTAAREEWERQREREEKQTAIAEEWLQAIEQGMPHLADKLARCANVVAATTTALLADPHFGERGGKPALAFDRLILEEAHQVTESEFAAAARRAGRWVLVGEPQPEDESVTPSRKVARSAVPRPGLFQRLWQNLHTDPHRLPFAWFEREGRLVCRLRPLPSGQEKFIETEAVADQPDIELRILSAPRQSPQIVEVVFPACMEIAEAKQFIYRELGEWAVGTRGRVMVWSENDEEAILRFSANDASPVGTVVLEEGISECARRESPALVSASHTNGDIWDTRSVRFARAAGWTRERAEQWIAERLGLRTLGRTALLTVPHRLAPPLARFVSDLLFGGICESPATATDAAVTRSAVEFVAVPSLASVESRHRTDAETSWNGGESSHRQGERNQGTVSVRAPRLRSIKGGAGLELDLADNRPLEQLPPDLRAILPRAGLVNYLEARSLVKRLEALLREESFRAACERWRGPNSELRTQNSELNAPVVAVMALYPAQVELLRHLVRQTESLARSPLTIEVGLPSAFHQRECLIGLVSLTRSHTHRAVCYGDHPHVLAQALTRAASGLILFGDPGTLARRSQWHGALDHLDEAAARREGRLAAQLVQYLQGRGPHPSAFHMQEGSSV